LLNEFLKAGLTEGDFMPIGVTLAADVPYCIIGGIGLSKGIGEKLTLYKALLECTFVIEKPAVSVLTAEAYGGYVALVEQNENDTNSEDSWNIIVHQDIDGMFGAIEKGNLRLVADKFMIVLNMSLKKDIKR